jgi:uridine kinase
MGRWMPHGGSADRVIKAVARWQAAQPGGRGVLVLAIDGHGAAGKSTIADAVARATGAALIHTDDFFRPPPAAADTRAMEGYYDWRRLRAQALEPLRARHAATFRRFDWERGRGLDDRVAVQPSDLVLVEGVFSAAAELSDLVDRSVFVETPELERLRRLRRLVIPEEWDEDWLAAERSYFGRTRPSSSFDLVVPGTGPFRQVAGR